MPLTSARPVTENAPHLRRALGRWDLVLLFVVAVANVNVVPVVAASGAVTIWLWLLALTFFFWPQGVAVIELSRLYPGEGGVYRWTKELFGDFHGFISGWCYWTNNVFYVPSVLLYLVGVCVYVGGERAVGLLDHRLFVFLVSFGLLWLLAGLNVRGLAVGKWVNNLGGIGTVVAATALVGLSMCVMHAHAATLPLSSFSPRGADWRLLSTFGVICFGLVGLELGSVMGDEILDPQHTVPSAVLWGDVISGAILAQEEIFGPVATVIPFSDETQALRIANDTPYGLAAAVWSRDIFKAFRVVKALRAGVVWVNHMQPTYVEAPWGGYKQSGFGRELGPWGMEEYLETKQVHINLNEQPIGWY